MTHSFTQNFDCDKSSLFRRPAGTVRSPTGIHEAAPHMRTLSHDHVRRASHTLNGRHADLLRSFLASFDNICLLTHMSQSQQPGDPESLASDFSSIMRHAESFLQAINRFIDGQVEAFEPEIREPIAYCLAKGGKRIRPVLVHAAGHRESAPVEDLIKIGAIIELVHMATLVHDDILDGASVRHGRPSVCAQYGSGVAVLLGDALFSHALRLAAEFPTAEICREVATSTRTVCAGEIHQTFQRGNSRMDLADYYRCIEMKTAELFRVACFLGAKVSGHDAAFCKSAAVFGNALGTAYQLFDDYADLFSTESRMGKTLNTDLEKGKFTLPMLLLLEAMPQPEREKWLQDLNGDLAAAVQHVEKAMQRFPVKTQFMEHFERQIEVARHALDGHRHLPAASRLEDLLRFVDAQIRLLT
jgi:octaprenyl-diphosphate synthase